MIPLPVPVAVRTAAVASADHLDPELVGLDVLQVDLALLDEVLVNFLAVLPRLGLPASHRSLVEAEGGDDGLDRATVAE
ncbi:MAG: hypothetical protein HYY04_18060 [Chloroflexi bacterium]|nr:hypothetical protein [Chloroflexota bacterium]